MKLNILVAYPYLDKSIMRGLTDHAEDIRFLLDSGAFTAWKKGTEIQLKDYLEFVEGLPIKPWRYFMLDKIGDHAETMRNYDEMLRLGHDPIPIFTRGQHLEDLEYYYSKTDLVGIGGLVGTQGNKGFVRGIMEANQGRPVHWLGFTRPKWIRYYKPYSCDSSSFTSGQRFGTPSFYAGNGRYMRCVRTKCAERIDPTLCNLIEFYDENPYDLRTKKAWTNSGSGKNTVERMSMKSAIYEWYELTKETKSKIFFAACTEWQIRQLFISLEWARRKGIITKELEETQ